MHPLRRRFWRVKDILNDQLDFVYTLLSCQNFPLPYCEVPEASCNSTTTLGMLVNENQHQNNNMPSTRDSNKKYKQACGPWGRAMPKHWQLAHRGKNESTAQQKRKNPKLVLPWRNDSFTVRYNRFPEDVCPQAQSYILASNEVSAA